MKNNKYADSNKVVLDKPTFSNFSRKLLVTCHGGTLGTGHKFKIQPNVYVITMTDVPNNVPHMVDFDNELKIFFEKKYMFQKEGTSKKKTVDGEGIESFFNNNKELQENWKRSGFGRVKINFKNHVPGQLMNDMLLTFSGEKPFISGISCLQSNGKFSSLKKIKTKNDTKEVDKIFLSQLIEKEINTSSAHIKDYQIFIIRACREYSGPDEFKEISIAKMRELSAEQEETFKSFEGNARALGIKRKSKNKNKRSILGKIKLLVGKKFRSIKRKGKNKGKKNKSIKKKK
uniref:Uncharacterized protein n=1 Tax=Mimiviridae sp. ChoanoV1 TaxID=2596887 RepID=A0A5B8IFJ2_9VIRU|nr:hypothetical protein 1_142 [Mimiviridae sp. ChoanoV1]